MTYNIGDKGILSRPEWGNWTFFCTIVDISKKNVIVDWKVRTEGNDIHKSATSKGQIEYEIRFFESTYRPLTRLEKSLL